MKEALTPERPSETRALNDEPPGTASIGLPPLKMMSSTVSPIPITLRICLSDVSYFIVYHFRFYFSKQGDDFLISIEKGNSS